MRKIIFISLLLCNQIHAQHDIKKEKVNDCGLLIGLGIGAGTLTLNYKDTTTIKLSTTLPNIKVGDRFNKKIALCILLPGANYKYHGKDRGFEGFVPSVQYWIKPKWWVLMGSGLTFDAPAFYTVDDPKKAAFYAGFPSVIAATGFEILHKNRFTIDVQYRIFYGQSKISNNTFRTGISNMIIIGLNWENKKNKG